MTFAGLFDVDPQTPMPPTTVTVMARGMRDPRSEAHMAKTSVLSASGIAARALPPRCVPYWGDSEAGAEAGFTSADEPGRVPFGVALVDRDAFQKEWKRDCTSPLPC